MFRTLSNIARFYGNYRYYRHMGVHILEAWQLAKLTLPD
jgi:hypothetical protein